MKISICGFPCHAIESIIELEMMIKYKQAPKKTCFMESNGKMSMG
jgi:hypothetical protein